MSRKKSKKLLPPHTRKAQRAIKVRIHPTAAQEVLLQKTFGCSRLYWNNALADEQRFYEETDEHFIPTPAKYKKQFPFLKEVDSLALCNTQLALESAFSKFFDKDDKAAFPKFKSKKKSKKSYTTNVVISKNGKANLWIGNNFIHLPKVGDVAANIYRKPMDGWALKSATVSQSASKKYYCSLLFEYTEDIPESVAPTLDRTIGLDYSSPHFYVDDQNESPEFEHFFRKSEEKLGKMQRRLTRMEKGSKNYEQQKQKIAELHEHIANQRKDFAHKESRRIANAYDVVCVEDIDLRGLSGSLHLGKSTMDNGFGMFRNMLEYKLNEQGKHFVKIDRWYPSSKTCSACGTVNASVVLGVDSWTCPHCGAHHIRDQNGAINIKHEGFAMLKRALAPDVA